MAPQLEESLPPVPATGDVRSQNAALVEQNQQLRAALCAALRTQMAIVTSQLAMISESADAPSGLHPPASPLPPELYAAWAPYPFLAALLPAHPGDPPPQPHPYPHAQPHQRQQPPQPPSAQPVAAVYVAGDAHAVRGLGATALPLPPGVAAPPLPAAAPVWPPPPRVRVQAPYPVCEQPKPCSPEAVEAASGGQ